MFVLVSMQINRRNYFLGIAHPFTVFFWMETLQRTRFLSIYFRSTGWEHLSHTASVVKKMMMDEKWRESKSGCIELHVRRETIEDEAERYGRLHYKSSWNYIFMAKTK